VSGKVAIIYPADRLVDLLYHLRYFKLEPKWLRQVQPKSQIAANRVIVHAIKDGHPGLKIESPLIIHGPDGTYSHEVNQMLIS
jgi:tRNA1(Val) A37 N6-methylase TrmN6